MPALRLTRLHYDDTTSSAGDHATREDCVQAAIRTGPGLYQTTEPERPGMTIEVKIGGTVLTYETRPPRTMTNPQMAWNLKHGHAWPDPMNDHEDTHCLAEVFYTRAASWSWDPTRQLYIGF